MDSSSSSSTRQPSPSPSPRTMRRGGRPSSHSRTTSQDSNSFFHPSHNQDHPQDRSTTSQMYGTQTGRHPSLSLPIPHSNEDLDRIRLEQQLGSLSMMSSSHASSSAAARSVDDDDGSSVEMGRGYDGRNLSGAGGGGRDGSTLAGGSYSTIGGASPVSTAGHHVSAVTLRAGLVGGAGGRHGGGGAGEAFDEDRELGRMLNNAAGGAGGGISFGLGEMGLGDSPTASSKHHHSSNRRVTESDFRGANKGRSSPGRPAHSVNNENQPPSSRQHHHPSHLPSPLRPKLADGLTRSFSPKRPSSIASPPPNHQRGNSGRAHQESRFETLARGLEDQIRVGGGSRMAMGEVSLNGVGGEGRRHPSGGARRKGGRGGGPNSSFVSSTGLQKDGGGKMMFSLPQDVTGMSRVHETPGRAARRDMGDGGDEDDSNANPLPSLATLSSRLTVLESQNSHSRKRIVELELELQTAGEREQAAKEEWRLERDYLKAEQRERERERTSNGRVQEGEWEKRYWEVVEEKKALEALVQTLRAQLARLTSDLTNQRNLITQLQNQRSLDAAEISRRGEEVERLRQEVAKLATEVGGLRRAVEGREQGRREVQTSPLLSEPRRERDGLGFDMSRIEEQDERTERVQRKEGGGVTAEELARLQADVERRQAARTSPVERPSSRLSDGLRAVASLNQDNLSNPSRSPPLGQARPVSSSSTARPSSPHHTHTNARPSSSRHANNDAKSISNERDQLDQLFPALPSPYDSGPPSPPRPAAAAANGWARSFVREEEIIDVDEQDRTARPRAGAAGLVDEGYGGEVEGEESLINFDDDEPAVSSKKSTAPKASASWSKGKKPSSPEGGKNERLPPQTTLTRVIRELEDDFGQYMTIYVELADQYKLMDPASNVAKRNVLAEHLKEVIDTLEQKGDQIAALYSLLTFADRPLSSSAADMSTSEKKAFKSVKDLLRSVKEKPRKREGVV